jgi:hypothetical protein
LPETGIGGPSAYMGPRQHLKRSLPHDGDTVDVSVTAQDLATAELSDSIISRPLLERWTG